MQDSERERYARHLALPEIGAAGQARLAAASVLIVGAGGLGSPAALYLTAAGIGRLGLVDGDRIDLSNLQRQVLYDTPSVGALKVEVAARRLRDLNPHVRIEPHAVDIDAENARALIGAYDVVLDGSDRLGTRYLVNDACVLYGKPLVTAAIHRFEGQAMTYVPGRGPCYRCLFPSNAEGLVANCAEAGVMGVLPGLMGALQAAEAIKLVTGIGECLIGRLLLFDALAPGLREFRFARRAECAVCGERPSIVDLSAHVREPATARISSRELFDWLASGTGLPVLVDVRAPAEFALDHLLGSLNLPLAELPGRLDELPAQRPAVFICRSGGRSQQAARVAARAGRGGADRDLEGGLLAWARDVDPTLRVAEP